jgi:hypothetical protein
MSSRAFRIAQLMCRATDETLSPLAHGVSLQLRVGSGRATYHRYDPATGEHRINYGVRMVADKASPETCSAWLSAREIRGRGYFGGILSESNLLAHTCCHEFAHLLQTRQGRRRRGSVHNQAFYRLLDELHGNGHADALKRSLHWYSESMEQSLATTAVDVAETTARTAGFERGDLVRFGQGLQGRVLRVNRKTCTIEGTGRCRGRWYRVSPQLLHRTQG